MDKAYSEEYEDLYRRHWWWRSREAMVLSVIRSLGFRLPIEILDVGCGNGLFFSRLSEFGRVRGIEVDRSLITDDCPYRDRIHTKPLGDPQYRGWRFDLITALDVIEHIEDDRAELERVGERLSDTGCIVDANPAAGASSRPRSWASRSPKAWPCSE